MIKVQISGYSRSEGTREFEILDREALENMIDDLDPADIYRRTFRMADGYSHSGTAYTYIDARDGSIHTCWIGSNSFNHPWDSFYEIWLCHLTTGTGAIDLDTVECLLDTGEMKRWWEFEGSLEEFLGEEYEERKENAIEWEASEYSFNWGHIGLQLDELYDAR